MKIKTGARILALSALTTMMFSASALAKIEGLEEHVLCVSDRRRDLHPGAAAAGSLQRSGAGQGCRRDGDLLCPGVSQRADDGLELV